MIDLRTDIESFVRSMVEIDRAVAPDHVGLASLLETAGTWFQGRANSTDYDCTKRWKKKYKPKPKECFYNAQTFCMDFKDSCYYEGYLLASLMREPVEHAWVVAPDGKVIDFTLEAMERTAKKKKISFDTRQALYLGLEVPTSFIWDKRLSSQWCEPIAVEYFMSFRQVE